MPDTQTALISGAVSAGVSLVVSYFTRRSAERTAIDARVIKAIELGMSYPHVEDPAFCREWASPLPQLPADAAPEAVEKHQKEAEKRLQYDLYCCFVFNLLEDIWRHCWRESHIPRVLHAEEFIESHRCWWEGQTENLFGYEEGFRRYVSSVLDTIKRREAKL